MLATHKQELDSIKSKLLQQHIENERLKKELATSNSLLSEAKQAQPSTTASQQQADSQASDQQEQQAPRTATITPQGVNTALKRTTAIQQQFQQETTPAQASHQVQTEDHQQQQQTQQQHPATVQSKRTREEDK